MIDRLTARRAALIKTHGELEAQLGTVTRTLERVRGALALCDELLAAPEAPEAAAPPVDAPPG